MFIRSERKAWNIAGVYLTPGSTMPIDHETLKKYQRLVDRGDLAVFEKDPNAKAKAVLKAESSEDTPKEKPKARTKRKRSAKKKVDDA